MTLHNDMHHRPPVLPPRMLFSSPTKTNQKVFQTYRTLFNFFQSTNAPVFLLLGRVYTYTYTYHHFRAHGVHEVGHVSLLHPPVPLQVEQLLTPVEPSPQVVQLLSRRLE